MRKLTVAAVIAVLSLTVAGAALAFTQFSNITFTTHKAGHATGLNANVYGKVSVGENYKNVKKMIVTFPAGTKFNLGKIKPCTLSDKQIKAGQACPSSSYIGKGSATVFVAAQPVTAGVKSYVAGPKTMLVVATVTKPTKLITVIRETTSGNKLTIPVPPLKFGALTVVLTKLSLKVPPRGNMIVAGKCTKGQFVIKSHFEYRDASPTDVKSTSSCHN